jgi:hypothetical protein
MQNHPLFRASAIGVLIAALTFAGRAGESCSACLAPALPVATASTASAPAAEPGHPLRGVILEILPEKHALLVNHEEIPGVMRAMTMLLKVDAATLAAAKKNQAITATLTRRADGWWLSDVVPAPDSDAVKTP